MEQPVPTESIRPYYWIDYEHLGLFVDAAGISCLSMISRPTIFIQLNEYEFSCCTITIDKKHMISCWSKPLTRRCSVQRTSWHYRFKAAERRLVRGSLLEVFNSPKLCAWTQNGPEILLHTYQPFNWELWPRSMWNWEMSLIAVNKLISIYNKLLEQNFMSHLMSISTGHLGSILHITYVFYYYYFLFPDKHI